MIVSAYIGRVRTAVGALRARASTLWARYRSLRKWQQIVGAALLIVLLFGVSSLFGGREEERTSATTTVSLATVGSLSGTEDTVNIIGAVRSVTGADILAQSAGTVTWVNARIGDFVPAGFVVAQLENASQRAAVLQAEGAYEAALASRTGTSESARNTYATAYSTLDNLLESEIDTFFGPPGGQGPRLLVSSAPFDYLYFAAKREALTDAMDIWRDNLAAASESDPKTLLNEAETVVNQAIALGNDLSIIATKINTDATDDQRTALQTARSGFAALQASITSAKSENPSTTASAADAGVKVALGGLRVAQAALEKTLVRAPVSGTINFLPIRTGDYVTSLMHVASIAQNATLEILAQISEESRATLAIGSVVLVEDSYSARVTSISPALDPVTKQIEVRFALTEKNTLVNGASVRIALPSGKRDSTVSSHEPLLLPLTALKLTPSSRAVFSVNEEGRLATHAVEIGDVHGDRIEVLTQLQSDLRIVVDARGLSEGQKVSIATAL